MSIAPEQIAALIPRDSVIYVQSASAESAALMQALQGAGDTLGRATITGIFVPGLNRRPLLPNAQSRVLTYFMTPELQKQEAVDFLPLCYGDIRRHLAGLNIGAALFMVSPPDVEGYCSFGVAVDFLAELWPRIPVRIAHINPDMPHTRGDARIPFSALTAWFEASQALLEMPDPEPDDAARAIGMQVAEMVPDGATLQTGLGRIPGSVLRALTGKRGLRIHSGLIGDAVLDLLQAGALAPGAAVTAGVAIGSRRLYDAVDGSSFRFAPVGVTHGIETLRQLPKLHAINAAFSVDLLGQAYAEVGPRGLTSGPGGASDFARGAREAGGVRIVVLASTAEEGRISRIVAPGEGAGPVSLGRMDIDVVVTEHGRADLRGAGYQARAERLIAIAAPQHRNVLRASWRDYSDQLQKRK